MTRKNRYTVTLPPHVMESVSLRAKALSTTDADYIARIAIEWFSRGCPAVSAEEAALQKETRSLKAAS